MKIDKSKKNSGSSQKTKRIIGYQVNNSIIEKRLKIPPDYQYKAINSRNFIQANWHKNKLFVLQDLLVLNKNMAVLDLGSGSGNFEIAFADKVKKIIAVDYNDEALLFLGQLLLKNKIKNVELVQSDVRKFRKLKNLPKFDLVIIADVLEHLEITEVKKLIKYLRKLLKRGGKVAIITPNYKGPWPLVELILDRLAIVPKFQGAQHLSKLSKRTLEDIFFKNNYKQEKVCSFNLISFTLPFRKISQALCFIETRIPIHTGNLIAAVFSYPNKIDKAMQTRP